MAKRRKENVRKRKARKNLKRRATKKSVKKVARPVKIEKRKEKRWVVGGIAAFAILVIIGFVINGAILAPVWEAMERAGVLREAGGGTTALIVYAALLLVAGVVLSGIVTLGGIHKAGQAALVGLLIGIIPVLFEFVVFLFYRTPVIVPVLNSIGHIVGFSLATWVAWRVSN